jgi:membrane dipeptidase
MTPPLSSLRIIDGHNDLPIALRFRHGSVVDRVGAGMPDLHTDLPRLRSGQIGGQFWSLFVPTTLPGAEAVQMSFEQIDLVHRLVAAYPDQLALCRTADDMERARSEGRIGSLMGLEGGHSIGDSVAILRVFAQLGVRYMTLTHNDGPGWAEPCTIDPGTHGLTDRGRVIVREMNRLGMLVDLSHVAPATMAAALDATRAPVIFSHSGARSVCDHARNVPDDILARIPANGGIVMATFVPAFVSPTYAAWEAEEDAVKKANGLDFRGLAVNGSANPAALARWRRQNVAPEVSISEVADHIDHIRDVSGIAAVGLGGDFDGIPALPRDLSDVSTYPRVLAELDRRGWSYSDLSALCWDNSVRVLRDAENVALALTADTVEAIL